MNRIFRGFESLLNRAYRRLDNGDVFGALKDLEELNQRYGFRDEAIFTDTIVRAATEITTSRAITREERITEGMCQLWMSGTFKDTEDFDRELEAACLFTEDRGSMRYLEGSSRWRSGINEAEERRGDGSSFLCTAATIALMEAVCDGLQTKYDIDARTEPPPQQRVRRCSGCKKYLPEHVGCTTCAGGTDG